MIKKIRYLIITLQVLLLACNESPPKESEIVGDWLGADNAKFSVARDGSFFAENLPADIFFIEPKLRGSKFEGTGSWIIRKGQSQWEMYLHFNKVSLDFKGYEIPLLLDKEQISGDAQWYIFLWKEEEGGERFELHKK